jgi:ribonuclease P protein component
MKDVIALRIGIELLKEIDKISKKLSADRSSVVRDLVKRGLKEMLKENSAEMYKEDKVTMSEAAHSAGFTLWEFEKYLVEKGYKSEYSIEDLEKELELLK